MLKLVKNGAISSLIGWHSVFGVRIGFPNIPGAVQQLPTGPSGPYGSNLLVHFSECDHHWAFNSCSVSMPTLSTCSFRAVGSPLVMDPNSICRKTRRLAGKQAELCQNQPEIVSEVAKGARLGIRECQYQFRYRRWNCTSHNKYFGKILQQGEWRVAKGSLLGLRGFGQVACLTSMMVD